MAWFVLTVLTALFESFKDVAGKKSLGSVDVYLVSWAWKLFTVLFLLPALLYTGAPAPRPEFWGALLVGGTLNVVATLLYMTAIQSSDLSITVPMIAFTPMFLVVTSPLILGEWPDVWGLLGIALGVAGSYVMNLKRRSEGFLAPLRALLQERGPKLMLIVALLWSVTANVDKVGVRSSSALTWATALNVYILALLMPLALFKSSGLLRGVRANLKSLVPLGLFSALAIVLQMTAIQLTLVAYVISVKRTSAVFSVLLGAYVFGEPGLRERLAGVLILLLGVLLIAVS